MSRHIRDLDRMSSTPTNRHPVDRLADIRHEKAVLQMEEDMIRDQLIRREITPVGDQYGARVELRTLTSIPVKKAQELLDSRTFKLVSRVKDAVYVLVRPIQHVNPLT
jgi:hypothetical protein